jgi:zinc transporter ZupT
MFKKKKQRKPFSFIAAVLLAVICVIHAVRAAYLLPVMVGQTVIPIWMSFAAAIFTGVLAVMVWLEARR